MPGANEDMEVDDNLRVADSSDSEQLEDKSTEKEKTFTQEDVDKIIGKEKARMERKFHKSEESKLSKAKELESTLRAGLGLEETDDVLEKVKDFYKEQGIDIPDLQPTGSNRDAEILGRADANELIEMYDIKDIEARANELATKGNKLTSRENAEFLALGDYLTEKLEENELKENGVDTNILQNSEFKKFAKKFNKNTSISDVYNIFTSMNNKETGPEKPKSTGSIKSTVPDNEVKEYYSPEDVDKLSSKQLDNPKIFKRVRESMKHWK